MSTSKQFTVRKHLVNKYRVSAEGYYDTIVQKKVTGDDTLTVNLTPWPIPTLDYTDSLFNPGSVNLESGDFKDHTYRREDTKLLMPYDHGRLYRDVKDTKLNYYLVNNGCTITDGVASFTGSNSILIDRELGNYSSLEITLKCLFSTISKNSAVASDSTSTERDIGIRSNNQFSMYCNGWNDGSTTVEANKWYFLKLVVSDNTSKFYTLEAEDYEYSTLPSIESWSLESTASSKIFSDKIYLGYDCVYHDESLIGSIDLTQSKILVNNEVFWEYPQTVYLNKDMQGCLETATDGTAHTYTAYTIKDDQLNQRLLLSDSAGGLTSYTFDENTLWTVPNGLTEVLVDCVGASGAVGNSAAGKGGRVQCTMQVAAGEQYYINVGKIPTSNQIASYNASDIRTSQNNLNSRLVVAGGGGSGGYAAGYHANSSSAGGDGGDLTADKGADTPYYHGNATGGNGGSQSSGGSGSSSGTLGLGGNGGNYYVLGGAGGAGYYGGGGGSAGVSKHDDNLYSHAAGGGGGSSYTNSTLCSSITHTKGFRTGNGYITLTAANQGGTIFSPNNELKAYKLSTITIPAHDTYTYTEEETLVPGNVDLVGDLTLDTSTGVVTNFATNRYCLLSSTYSLANADSFEFQIKFKRTAGCSNERIFGLGGVDNHYGVTLAVDDNRTYWWIGSYQGGWDIAYYRIGVTSLTIGTVFWVKVIFDGSSYKCYTSTNGVEWILDFSVDSSTHISPTLSPILGTAESPSNQSMNGEIYLNDCYFKIENDTVWSGLGKVIKGKWTKNI